MLPTKKGNITHLHDSKLYSDDIEHLVKF